MRKSKTPIYLRRNISKYQKTSTKRVFLVLDKGYDSKLIDKLDSVVNISGYIKELIRLDLDSHEAEAVDKGESSIKTRYHKSEKRRVSFLINRTTDANVLARIEAQSNASAYIRMLIAEDIA